MKEERECNLSFKALLLIDISVRSERDAGCEYHQGLAFFPWEREITKER